MLELSKRNQRTLVRVERKGCVESALIYTSGVGMWEKREEQVSACAHGGSEGVRGGDRGRRVSRLVTLLKKKKSRCMQETRRLGKEERKMAKCTCIKGENWMWSFMRLGLK